MQFIVPFFVGALGQAMASLVGRVLLALGVSFVTYTGLSVGLDAAKDAVITNMVGLPAQTVAFLAWMKIDQGLSMIFSATAAALVIRGLTSAGITRMHVRGVASA